jgi:hypothetical protein
MIRTVKIYPPIGIARLGKSPDGFFIGPERPLDSTPPVGGYRDAAGQIKRQAARFRLFGFDENGKLAGEVTFAEADEITWTVHVANTKAAADRFFGRNDQNAGPRNAGVQDRAQLRLDSGPISVSGRNPNFSDLAQARATGRTKEFAIHQQFLGHVIQLTLGTVTTDDEGRLLVLGGHGESRSPINATLHEPGSNFANHDGWYDDVSDGVVSATVRLKDGTAPAVSSAWVIVGPPKYAPGIHHVVSLYDTLRQHAVDQQVMPSPFVDPAFKPSMAEDILPLLARAANMRWVYSGGDAQFNPAISFHHTFNALPPAGKATVFNRLSIPSSTPGEPGTGGGDMPRMWSDLYPNGTNGTLTRIQHKMIEMWKNGATVPGSPPLSGDPVTPEGLTRAALETCVGGAFFPGIEASWKIRDVLPFVEPFRFDAARVHPGDVTSQMSLPWQSDFLDCAVEPSTDAAEDLVWWPAQRPINVLRAGSNTYVPWARTTTNGTQPMSIEQMITGWGDLGFVLEANGRFEDSRT